MIPRGAISADSHVSEPPNCYIDFIDPKYRADAPHIETLPDGQDVYVIKDLKRNVPLALLDGAGYSIPDRNARVGKIKFKDTRDGGWNPKAREADQIRDGIAAEVMYASVGMALCTHPDPDYKNACMQAYNRWLQTFCAGLPDRLFGLAMTAVLSVDSAIEDFRRAKEMGFVGMMMPGEPVHEDYDHPSYDALWECASDLGLPICFHILTSRTGGLGRKSNSFRGHSMNGFMTIIRAVQDIIGMMVLGGVFERHPKLKLVCAEGDAGWMPHYMYRMDHAAKFNVVGGLLRGMTKLPSEYLKSNVWMTFQDDWIAFETAHLLNDKQLIWANDFPHTDSTWPKSQELLNEHARKLTEAQRQGIMRDNVAALFNLPAGNESWQMNRMAAE